MNRKRLFPLFFALGLVVVAAAWLALRAPENRSEQERIADKFPRSPKPRSPQPPALAPPQIWKKAPENSAQAARKAIVAQLEAFKKDDWKTAQKYQSAGLRANFGSTENFRRAIENGYPQFADYREVRFLDAFASGQTLRLGIEITGMDGVQQKATYFMAREKDGWKVASVMGGLVAPEQNAPTEADSQLI